MQFVGHDHAESLVRTLLVVTDTELVEGALLGRERGSRRSRCLDLERPMKSFLPAILLRLARLNALGIDAKPDEPNRNATKAADADGCEWGAIVGAHASWESELAER